MSKTTQEGVFILLKVIKMHEEKRPEGRTELMKLKTTIIPKGKTKEVYIKYVPHYRKGELDEITAFQRLNI